ncbi:hypothetical protein ACFLVN_01685 [Chloroflexota bacterium]
MPTYSPVPLTDHPAIPPLTLSTARDRIAIMLSLGAYGKIIREYEGNGLHTLNTGQTCNCSVRAVQLADGKLMADCLFTENLELVRNNLFGNDATKSIRGFTKENDEFALGGQILYTNFTERTAPDEHTISMVVIADNLAYHKQANSTLKSIRFGITNLQFIGNKIKEYSHGGGGLHILVIELAGRTIEIHEIEDYKNIIESVKAQRGIDVTCEAVLEICSEDEVDSAIQLVDTLCKLLSFARGTKINWIYYDCFDSRGEYILSSHNNNVVWRYAGIPLIDPRNPNDTAIFIEQAYPSYVSIQDKYSLGKSIEAYLDAKREGVYLETRALVAAVLLDFLSGIYVGKEIRFRKRIKAMLLDLGITVSDNDLIKLTKIRNSLAHEASFIANITKEYSDDYCFLISILDRIFLKILNYNGAFLDITNKYNRINTI